VADFLTAHGKTARAEGGYANDSDDRGGETCYGIARVSNPNWIGWPAVDAATSLVCRKRSIITTRDAGESVWAAVDEELARYPQVKASALELYRHDYWTPLGLDGEADQQLADMAYDAAVNEGVGVARDRLARARNA
jgi:lysozyme family protein